MKPQTWPENVWPTPDQWLEWFLTNEHDDQIKVASSLLAACQRAGQCFERNHEGAIEQIQRHPQVVLDAYNQGWNAALKKFSTTYEAHRAEETA